MVKVIQLEKKYDCEHLLGKFIDHDSYDILATEDMDVHKPLRIGEKQGEHSILLKFRKGVLSKQAVKDGWDGIYSGATLTDNRGLAAGAERQGLYQQLPNGQGARRWVTKREKAVLDYFADGSPSSLFGDRAQEIYDETPHVPLEGRGGGPGGSKNIHIKGGSIWIVKLQNELDFDTWFKEMLTKSPKERQQAAIAVANKYISDSTYGQGVNSGVGGYFDRYPRIPFCRETSWSAGNPEKFQKCFKMFQECSSVYRKNLPIRWKGQYEAALKLKGDGDWQIGDTVYTTVTINRQFRTACHRDAGDLCEDGTQEVPRGFSNLTVLTNGKKFDGFYLCFPEYRVAAHIEEGDLIMMDAHQIHGNVPVKTMDEDFERISVVMYFRESLLGCGTKAFENLRRQYVYARKADKDHPDWHPGWNGISPGMWDQQDWKNYLSLNGMVDEDAA